MFFKNTNKDELSFQSRNLELQGGSAAFGCSATWGEGVQGPESWPELIGVYNAGQPGSSNDRITRLAIEYINEYRPSSIYVLWTLKVRREYILDDSTPVRFNPTRKETQNTIWHRSFVMLSNNADDNYNFLKNKLLLESFCSLHNVTLYQLDMMDFPFTNYPLGNDNSHPGPIWHENVAQHFINLQKGNTNDF